MKKVMMIVGTGAVVAMLSTFTACKKENYDDKYQPKGNYQPAGNYGNANVISKTVTLSYTYDTNNNLYYANVSVPEITSKVINNGLVQCYIYIGSGWVPLTFSGPNGIVGYAIDTGIVEFFTNLSMYTSSPYNQAKIVIVNPAGRMANPNVNYKNYEEVKKAFNLKD
jgi:hypothetical protein